MHAEVTYDDEPISEHKIVISTFPEISQENVKLQHSSAIKIRPIKMLERPKHRNNLLTWLQLNLKYLFKNRLPNLDEKWNKFNGLLSKSQDMFCLLKKVNIRKSPDFIPSKNLEKEMEKRNKLRSTYFLNKTEENKKAYTMQRNKVNRLVNDEKRTQQLKMCRRNATSIKFRDLL